MDAGGLKLTAVWDGECIVAARIASTRTAAARALVGRDADAAVALVPRLFSLCGQAQGLAARLALAAARGEAVDVASDGRLPREVVVEAIGEALWRLCLDWPALVAPQQAAAAQDAFRHWRLRLLKAPPADDAALAADLLAALPGLLPASLPDDCAAAATPLLPFVAAADWAGQAVDATFAQAPTWNGAPAETGALARHAGEAAVATELAAGRRVAARLVARLADLRLLAEALVSPGRLAGWCGAVPLAAGVGLARVETARGLLLHMIQVKDDRVGRYVIVAPTEWNFHPQGVFAAELAGNPAATRDEAARRARRLALALDPCVNYEVGVEDA